MLKDRADRDYSFHTNPWGVNRTQDGRWGRLKPDMLPCTGFLMSRNRFCSQPPQLDTALMPHSPTFKAAWRSIRLKSPSNDVGHAMRANPQKHACSRTPVGLAPKTPGGGISLFMISMFSRGRRGSVFVVCFRAAGEVSCSTARDRCR